METIKTTESPALLQEERPEQTEATPSPEPEAVTEPEPEPEIDPSVVQVTMSDTPSATIKASETHPLQPAATNFFSELYKILYYGADLTLTFRKDVQAGKLIVGVRPSFHRLEKDNPLNNLKPITMTHFIEDLDKSFFMTITAPIVQASDTAKSLKEWGDDLEAATKEAKEDDAPAERKKSIQPKAKAKAKPAPKPVVAKKPAPPKVDKKAAETAAGVEAETMMKDARIAADPASAIAKAKEARAKIRQYPAHKKALKEIDTFITDQEKLKKEADRKAKLNALYLEIKDMATRVTEAIRLEDWKPALGVAQETLKKINGQQEERFLVIAKEIRSQIKYIEVLQNRAVFLPKLEDARKYLSAVNYAEAVKILKTVFKADPENPSAIEIRDKIIDTIGQATYQALLK